MGIIVLKKAILLFQIYLAFIQNFNLNSKLILKSPFFGGHL